jgi:hypothetical protein
MSEAANDPEYILLEDWANAKFKPVPSKHTLWALARTDRIDPPAHKVGKVYYVAPDAKLKEPQRAGSLVRRLKDRQPA